MYFEWIVQQMLTPLTKSIESGIVISLLDMTWRMRQFNKRNKTIICEASKDASIIIIIGIG